MEELIKSIERNFTVFFIIVVTSIFSMAVYALNSKEELKQKVKSTFSGGIIAILLSYPTWMYFKAYFPDASTYYLVVITFVYTITGQFIPEFLQSIVPKIAKKFYKQKTGEDLNNDNH